MSGWTMPDKEYGIWDGTLKSNFEGSVNNTPVGDKDLVNKKYVDDAVAGGGGGGITNLDGGASDSNFGGIAISPIDGGDST